MEKKDFIDLLKKYFTENIPFNRVLGIEIPQISAELVKMAIKMKPELVGNTFYNSLHGGVTASILDVAGGLVAMVNTIDRLEKIKPDEVLESLKNTGTIDLRIDYLRPGMGNQFTAEAKVIRFGKKVSVARMELNNENNDVIALGTATYLVG